MSPLLTRKLASVANRQKLLPLAKVTLEPQAFGNLKRRDDACSICLPDFQQYSAKGYLARFGKALTLVGAVHCPYVIETSSGQSSRLDLIANVRDLRQNGVAETAREFGNVLDRTENERHEAMFVINLYGFLETLSGRRRFV